jgi:BirA family biotin operon repressor/biotin-[acetyl-CoA-carboxylase] ligase
MDVNAWKKRLEQLPIGELYLYQELGSTNQVANDLALQGAPPFSLVVADSQTAGKGRYGRSWVTQPGKALAFSLVLYPESGLVEANQLEKLSGLGGLAVAEVLSDNYSLDAEIKWPNDVLVDGKKIAGVLADANWSGPELNAVILGIGINVLMGSVPDYPLNFPASSLEELARKEFSRLDLLVDVLRAFLKWYPRITTQTFLTAWEGYLAYKKEQVMLISAEDTIDQGQLIGISDNGSLIILSDSGDENHYRTGEIHLRLVDRS